MKQYYFISGLPRSGSTLLSAILKQNPNFYSRITDSLLPHVRKIIEAGNMGESSEINPNRTEKIVRAAFDIFYEHVDKPVIFNTNRLWTSALPHIKQLFPYTKVICCVRNITEIIDSFERLHQKNPWSISTIYPEEIDLNVYTRTQGIMDCNRGVIGVSYMSLKSSICGPHKDMLFFCEYDILCRNPEGMMKSIYNFIGQPYFKHNFDDVESSYDEYDRDLNFPGLHKTKKRIEWNPRKLSLPPDIIDQYQNFEVWRAIR